MPPTTSDTRSASTRTGLTTTDAVARGGVNAPSVLSDPPGEADPIVLPSAWTPPARPALPLVAAAVPVVGAVVVWAITGAASALAFAALGPLLAIAALLDAARAARRSRRTHDEEAARRLAVAAAEIDRRHRAERERRRARHPDVAGFVARDEEVWRPHPDRLGILVAGRGACRSAVRVEGGEDAPASMTLRRRAEVLSDAPITVAVSAGVAVTGPDVLAAGVARALVIQLCQATAPGRLRITGAGEEWLRILPHCDVEAPVTVSGIIGGHENEEPVEGRVIQWPWGRPAPATCAAVLTVSAPGRARLIVGDEAHELSVEALSAEQAGEIALDLRRRAVALGLLGGDDAEVRFAALVQDPSARDDTGSRSLRAVLGRETSGDCVVDLVADGPHAVVAGVTGSGKSELLITWVLALCAGRSTQELTILLADFKGGTAFDSLAQLPHVVGVVTDLDGVGALRAIESLRAEVRWRERRLAQAGVRDVRDPRAALPRLVIIVDEFAALLEAHPGLQSVFTDIAARGRALGMHLILGTQRVSGVIRDALLANCPLRISLRVSDAVDSRAVIGSDAAALLPGGRAGAGHALVRRSADATAHRARIALADADDIALVASRSSGPPPRRPWLPALPPRVALGDLDPDVGSIRLGLVDEPYEQRQFTATLSVADQGLLVVGGGGSGRSTLLRSIAAQHDGPVLVVPSSPERAWDALSEVSDGQPSPGTLVVVDDLDTLVTRFSQEYALVFVERMERLVRTAGASRLLVVASVRRIGGPTARVADLIAHRIVLALPSRAEHIAAGGDGDHYVADAPPGRGRLRGAEIQCVVAEPVDTSRAAAPMVPFRPARPTALIARRSAALRDTVAAWEGEGVRVLSVEDAMRDDISVVLPERAIVIAGGGEQWQRAAGLLARLRGDHDLVVDAASAPDYRLLTGDRELPPYCEPGRGRAWLRSAGGPPCRIVLPPGPTIDNSAT